MPTSLLVCNKDGQRLGARGKRTRERFIQAARLLLTKTSPIDLTASAISKGAGASAATFYLYFDDVRDVLLALSETASAGVEALFPHDDALLDNARLYADVETMIAAVNAAWDVNAAILLYRNLEADRGDARFDDLRTAQAKPMLERIAAAITARREPDFDPAFAAAEAAVLVAAIERIAVRMHRPVGGGPAPRMLSEALARLLMKGIHA